MKYIKSIKEIHLHRNGSRGHGFHVVKFVPADHPRKTLLAIVFTEPLTVAVITPGNITEMWRGDGFEAELRAAVEEYEKRETKRVLAALKKRK